MLTERKPHGWVVCYAFMLAFFLVMLPSLAYADTYVATEDSAVRAAMVYLGYDPDEGESTDKLVTAFYDATSGDEYTGWQSFVNGLYQPLGTVNYNEQWWSPADGFMFSAQVDGARTDAAKIYAAWKNTSSGGGGSGSEPDEVPETPNGYRIITTYVMPNARNYTGTILGINYGGTDYAFAQLPETIKVAVDKKFFTSMVALGHTSCYIYVAPSLSAQYPTNYDVYVVVPNDGYTLTYEPEQAINSQYRIGQSYVLRGTRKGYDASQVRYSASLQALMSGISTINSLSTSSSNRALPLCYWASVNLSDYTTEDPSGGGETEPEPEPEPEPPTPPEPPRDPTPPTPDPTQPSQTIDLQGIIDRLDIIIRNQVVLINWLDDAFASVTANIQWLGELIDESFGWLWEVLGDLQGSIDSGINRITTWLEMIYRKIGGQGGTVSRPNIDTPTPWDDFLSWLEGILQRLLDLIFGVTPAALQNLLSGLADLTSKFPFSIPWDLAALVALFAHAPVTPVIDFPLMVPFMNAPLPLHVDCTQWDGLASICRDGETVIFAAWLVLKTPDLYKHLSDVSGAD